MSSRHHHLAVLQEGIRRLVTRQRKLWIAYQALFGSLVMLFLVSAVNVLFNLLVSSVGLQEAAAVFIPAVFSCAAPRVVVGIGDRLEQLDQLLGTNTAGKLRDVSPWFGVNSPLNLFCGLPLCAPAVVFVVSAMSAAATFIMARGVFAIRKPSRYVEGMNAHLVREHGWYFDATVGRLVVCTKTELAKLKQHATVEKD
jgi:hypothetical protein